MALSDLRTLIDTALDGITGLNHSEFVPSVVIPPMAFPSLVPTKPVTYDVTAQNSVALYHFYVEVLVNKGATIEQAQDDLDPYLRHTGSSSIKETIEAIDWTSYADVCRVGDPICGPAVYGGQEYLGARFPLDIWVSS